jgi:hypothetical protein
MTDSARQTPHYRFLHRHQRSSPLSPRKLRMSLWRLPTADVVVAAVVGGEDRTRLNRVKGVVNLAPPHLSSRMGCGGESSMMCFGGWKKRERELMELGTSGVGRRRMRRSVGFCRRVTRKN